MKRKIYFFNILFRLLTVKVNSTHKKKNKEENLKIVSSNLWETTTQPLKLVYGLIFFLFLVVVGVSSQWFVIYDEGRFYSEFLLT